MNKKQSVIVINDRYYDAHTGRPLFHGAEPAARRKGHSRQAAKHLAAHRPHASRTLMRKVVSKPPERPRPRIRVQSHLGYPAAPQAPYDTPQLAHQNLHSRRPKHYQAKEGRGRLISHFSPDLFVVVSHVPPARTHDETVTAPAPATTHAPAHRAHAPTHRPTTSEMLEHAVRIAPAHHHEQAHAHRRKRRLLRRHVAVHR